MLNNSVVTFNDNFGLIFKGSEDKATNGIEDWLLSTTPQLTDASDSVGVYIRCHTVVSESMAENLVKPTMKTDISIRWHFKVTQGQSF